MERGRRIIWPYSKKLVTENTKKIKKMALMHSVVYKIQQNSFTIIDSFALVIHITKELLGKLNTLTLYHKILIISDQENDNLILSSRNIKNVKLIKSMGVNVYDLLNHTSIVIDKTTLDALIERIKS